VYRDSLSKVFFFPFKRNITPQRDYLQITLLIIFVSFLQAMGEAFAGASSPRCEQVSVWMHTLPSPSTEDESSPSNLEKTTLFEMVR